MIVDDKGRAWPVDELWSPEEETRAAECLRALERDDLPSALLAVEGAPPDVAVEVLGQLQAWGETLAERIEGEGVEGVEGEEQSSGGAARPKAKPSAGSAVTRANALATFLGHELGFRGDADDYYHARNSALSLVVERRRGLPIMLSSVWMAVGQAAGVPVEGVGMPGHFVARVLGARPDDARIVDPFSGGRILSIPDCKRIVQETSHGKLPWKGSHLATSSTSQIVERVLANLVQAHGRANDSMSMFRVLGFLVTLRPDVPSYSLKRAAAAEALGARGQAAHIYADVMRRYPGSEEASVAAERQRRTRAAHIWN